MVAREYILSEDEIALQIHRILSDLYVAVDFGDNDVRKFVVRSPALKAEISFRAADFAGMIGIDASELIDKLYMEIMVEYEKNWHDRTFFRILKAKDSIRFIGTGAKEND